MDGLLERKFAAMGARVNVVPNGNPWNPFELDVRSDRRGELFELRVHDARVELQVVDLRPDLRHLLLMSRDAHGKHKFLCGHDERHWFAAAIPEKARGVTGVHAAMEALKPEGVRKAQSRCGLPRRLRGTRRNDAFVRQGEWFFVPAPGVEIEPTRVLRNELLSRGRGGKPHVAEECARSRGRTLYVNGFYPWGLTWKEYQEAIRQEPWLRKDAWNVMVRDSRVWVRGAVRHADHRTIRLQEWHRVFLNTENRSRALRHVAYLD